MKVKYIILSIVLILGITGWITYLSYERTQAMQELSKSSIRFHVLANSDSKIDQTIKMKVKTNVVKYIYQNTKDMDTLEETRRFINSNDNILKEIALETLKENGFNYNVSSFFGRQKFPTKNYGDVSFPAGTYTSYTLILGKGKGHNWWCVLYPPLCFVDASTAVVPDSSKSKLKESLSDNEYNSIIKYRFKYLTFLNKYLD